MKNSIKVKALKQLVRDEDKTVTDALINEQKSISSILESQSQYDLLEEQLDYLEIISFRTAEETFKTIINFLSRLETIELAYQEVAGISKNELKRLYSKDSLIVKSYNILINIRYHKTEEIVDFFIKSLSSKNRKISSIAKEGLEKIAKFNITIYYGNKKWGGLRAIPQESLLKKLTTFNKDNLKQNILIIAQICSTLLSPTMDDVAWGFDTVTFKTASIPTQKDVIAIRINTIKFLEILYSLATNTKERVSVINAIETAASTPSRGNYTDELLNLIIDNIKEILDFYNQIISTTDFVLLSEIERKTHWMHRNHGHRSDVGSSTIAIKQKLESNEDFQIFKVLIKYEWTPTDWDNDESLSIDFDNISEFRKERAKEYSDSITSDNFPTWKKRILEFCEINASDIGLFYYFDFFLEFFAKTNPELAFNLLTENLSDRLIALINGLKQSRKKDETNTLIDEWISRGKNLFQIVWSLESSSNLDTTQLKKILDKMSDADDRALQAIFIMSVKKSSQENREYIIKNIFIPAIKINQSLTKTSWANYVWHLAELNDFLENLDENDTKNVLSSLITIPTIDYHAEEILTPIAKRHPFDVLRFLKERIQHKNNYPEYEVIPHEFYKLQNAYSSYIDEVVDIIIGWGIDKLIINSGTKLLKALYPKLPDELTKKLMQIARTKNKNSIKFLIELLRQYGGNENIFPICKEIARALPINDALHEELISVMYNTGVVSGKYGLPDAFKHKKNITLDWVNDPDTNISKLAKRFHEVMDAAIEAQTKRADEDDRLRRLQHGNNDDDEENN